MSYFRAEIDKIEGYTPGFQPKNAGVIKLNTNENPYPPSQKAIEALANLSPEQARKYPDPTGLEFKLAAAKVLETEPENIICCNGGDDLLNLAIRSICDSQRPIAYPVPTYTLYPVLANIQNCPIVEVPFEAVGQIPSALYKTNAALTIICNPNAPTGGFIEPQKISDFAKATKGVVLIDEAYVDFADDNCLKLVSKHDNIIILRSMSKGYSLAGLRFGFGIANPDLIEGLIKVKDSYNVNAATLAAAVEAIKDQKHLKDNVQKIKQQRQRLTDELISMGFSVHKSFTNFVLAVWHKGDAQWIYNSLAERNIFVRYWKTDDLKDKLRITVGTKQQNDKLIEALKDILA